MGRTALVSLLLLKITCPPPTSADSQLAIESAGRSDRSPARLSRGKELFRLHCASCHGIDGTGSGPVSPALKTAPPDLTLISKRHDGKFPRAHVTAFIDGGMPVASHGSREMPIWGRVFRPQRGRSFAGSPEISALTDYIESIQKKTAEELS